MLTDPLFILGFIGMAVCLFSWIKFTIDKNEVEPESPDSPLVKNERGELVRAKRIDWFDYIRIDSIITKQMIEWVEKVFKKNKKIPKNVKLEDQKQKQDAFWNKNQWRPWP